jgi:hypothetical protein
MLGEKTATGRNNPIPLLIPKNYVTTHNQHRSLGSRGARVIAKDFSVLESTIKQPVLETL